MEIRVHDLCYALPLLIKSIMYSVYMQGKSPVPVTVQPDGVQVAVQPDGSSSE